MGRVIFGSAGNHRMALEDPVAVQSATGQDDGAGDGFDPEERKQPGNAGIPGKKGRIRIGLGDQAALGPWACEPEVAWSYATDAGRTQQLDRGMDGQSRSGRRWTPQRR